MIWVIIALIILLILVLWEHANVSHLDTLFRKNNTITFGKKGDGKDLIFQKIINRQNKPYYATIPYDAKHYEKLTLADLSLKPNTYENFIRGEVVQVEKKLKENQDFYITDGGVSLPSQYDNLLSKTYPSFPIAYALSRQLWLMNIHINTQAIGRVWIKLREQADSYIKARGVINLPFVLLCFFRTYEKQKSAENDMSPMVVGLLANKYTKGEASVYEATNGRIKNGWFVIRKSKIKYDTRAYHKTLFGYEAKNKTRSQTKPNKTQ